MEKEIVFAGFGGQGVLTAGLILAHAANKKGKQILWMPAYGGQMRGGKSYSLVKISSEPVCHPDIEQLDVLVAMNLPSLEGFSGYVRKDGLILINSDVIPEEAQPALPGIRVLRAPFASLAKEAGNLKGANIAALGLLLRETELFSRDYFEEVMLQYFAEKGKSAYSDQNRAAFRAGYDYAAE